MSNISEDVAELLLKSGAVILRPKKPFTFTSGIRSPIYCDNRLLLSRPKLRKQIVDCYVRKMKEERKDYKVIAGIATASIPWAALIAEQLGKPMIYIRNAAKEHGRKNIIEGGLEKGQSVLVVEDLVSTGGSSVSSVEAARNEGGVVETCLAIFTYELDKAREAFEQAKCTLVTLSNFSTLVKVAAEKGYIKKEELETVIEWSKDPVGWHNG
jgi:orotate phosphoribosyltransferase